MKLKSYEDMRLEEWDVMREISSVGTSHAATALSQLLQKEIRITMPQVSILGYAEATGLIGRPEEIVAATLVKMKHDVNGIMLFLFHMDFANMMLQKLLGNTYSDFDEMDTLAYSALEEVGNIIICSYINAFSQLMGLEINVTVPSSTINMLGGILAVPMAEYGYQMDRLMYFNADFVLEGKKLSGWLLMLPDIQSMNTVLEKSGLMP